MKYEEKNILNLQPVTVKRLCRGWMAITSKEAPVKFATLGSTEEEAISNFRKSAKIWSEAIRQREILN